MRQSDRADFGRAIGAMLLVFGRTADKATLTAWWAALQDMELQAVQQAAGRAMRECEYPPVPATIRKLAAPSDAFEAQQAWARVVAEIRRVGTRALGVDCPSENDKPRLTDAEWDAVRILGGWRQLCMTASDQLHNFTRSAFEKVYTTSVIERRAHGPRRLRAGADEGPTPVGKLLPGYATEKPS